MKKLVAIKGSNDTVITMDPSPDTDYDGLARLIERHFANGRIELKCPYSLKELNEIPVDQTVFEITINETQPGSAIRNDIRVFEADHLNSWLKTGNVERHLDTRTVPAFTLFTLRRGDRLPVEDLSRLVKIQGVLQCKVERRPGGWDFVRFPGGGIDLNFLEAQFEGVSIQFDVRDLARLKKVANVELAAMRLATILTIVRKFSTAFMLTQAVMVLGVLDFVRVSNVDRHVPIFEAERAISTPIAILTSAMYLLMLHISDAVVQYGEPVYSHQSELGVANPDQDFRYLLKLCVPFLILALVRSKMVAIETEFISSLQAGLPAQGKNELAVDGILAPPLEKMETPHSRKADVRDMRLPG